MPRSAAGRGAVHAKNVLSIFAVPMSVIVAPSGKVISVLPLLVCAVATTLAIAAAAASLARCTG